MTKHSGQVEPVAGKFEISSDRGDCDTKTHGCTGLAANGTIRTQSGAGSGIGAEANSPQVGHTLEAFSAEYMKDHAELLKRPATVRTEHANLRNHILPLLGARNLKSIGRADIEWFRDEVASGRTVGANPHRIVDDSTARIIVRGGEGVANRCLSLLSSMFELAEQSGYIEPGSNPALGVARFKARQKCRTPTDEEIKRIYSVMDEMEWEGTPGMQFYVALFRIILWTGSPVAEMQFLQWTMVDYQTKVLRLPDTGTGEESIPLSEKAIGELRSLPKLAGNPYVFAGDVVGQPVDDPETAWHDLCEKAGVSDVRKGCRHRV